MISIRETWRCLTTLVSHQISAGERRDFKDGRRCVQIFVSGCCVCLCVDGLRDRRSIFIINLYWLEIKLDENIKQNPYK